MKFKFSIFLNVLNQILYKLYFLGQLDQIAREIYNLELETSVIQCQENSLSAGKIVTIVNLRLNFDNSQYVSIFIFIYSKL